MSAQSSSKLAASAAPKTALQPVAAPAADDITETTSVCDDASRMSATTSSSSRQGGRGKPLQFAVGTGRVIKGWDEALLTMRVGGRRMLVIPAELGYGAKGIGPIPPNADLVFYVELVAIGS